MKKEGALQLFGSGLLTDLYEITMSGVYYEELLDVRAVFELWVRNLPNKRGYLLAAGLEHAIQYLKDFHFSGGEIQYLREQKVFSHVEEGFFETLSKLRFTGDVWAMPEGSVFFANEPILRVEAPIIEAQLIETAMLNCMVYSTSIATKASRVCYAANMDGKKRNVVEFGARRAPGPGGSLYAARAAYIGGCAGTSNVYAGRLFNMPAFGTMAHSYVLAYRDEIEAFKSYHKLYPESTVLLIDTYDTIGAAGRVSQISKNIRAVRLDSGDVLRLSKEVRRLLDEQGLENTGIFVSGDLDEYRIFELVNEGASIDGFGVGTKMVTSDDAPYIGAIYKLVEVKKEGERRNVAKFSERKVTYPGSKQVVRFEEGGWFKYDLVAHEDEDLPEKGMPMVKRVMEKGKLIKGLPSLEEIRSYAGEQLSKLPEGIVDLKSPRAYEVRFSERLKELLDGIRIERMRS